MRNSGYYGICHYTYPYRQFDVAATLNVKNVTIDGARNHGILSHRTHVKIDNTTVRNCKSHGTYHTGSYFGHNKTYGEYSHQGSVTITNSKIENNPGHGVVSWYVPSLSVKNTSVSNNKRQGLVFSNYNGYNTSRPHNATLDRLTLKGNGWWGLARYWGNTTLTNSTIEGNGSGIWSQTGSLKLVNTRVRNNRDWGVYAHTSTIDVGKLPIEGNGWGVALYGHAGYDKQGKWIDKPVTLANAVIRNNRTGGVYMAHAQAKLDKLQLSNNGYYGVLGYSGSLDVTNSNISGQKYYGIYYLSHAYHKPYQDKMRPKPKFYGDSLRRTTRSKRRFSELVVKNCNVSRSGHHNIVCHYADAVIQNSTLTGGAYGGQPGYDGYWGYTNTIVDTNITFKNVKSKDIIDTECTRMLPTTETWISTSKIAKLRIISHGDCVRITQRKPMWKTVHSNATTWNRCVRALWRQVSFDRVTTVYLRDNVITHNSYAGVYGWVTDVRMYNNRITDNKVYGLGLSATSTRQPDRRTLITNNGYNVIFHGNPYTPEREVFRLSNRKMHSKAYWNVYTTHCETVLDNLTLTNEGHGGFANSHGGSTIRRCSTNGGYYGFYTYGRKYQLEYKKKKWVWNYNAGFAPMRVERSSARGAKYHGIYPSWVSNSYVKECTIENNNYGYVGYGSHYDTNLESHRIINSTVRNNNQGIYAAYTNLSIESMDNKIYSNKGNGLYCAYGDCNFVKTSQIHKNGTNFYLYGRYWENPRSKEYIGLDLSDATYAGLHVGHYNVKLTNCKFNNCKTYGAATWGGDTSYINCEARYGGAYGLYTHAYYWPTHKTNRNKLFTTGKTLIQNCNASNNGSWGILNYWGDTTVVDSTVDNNGAGIYSYRYQSGSRVTKTTLDRVRLRGNKSWATISYNKNLDVKRTICSNNKQHGLHSSTWLPDKKKTWAKIVLSSFDNNDGAGMNLTRTSADLQNVSISGNKTHYGFYTYGKQLDGSRSTTKLTNCNISKNLGGWNALTYWTHLTATNSKFDDGNNGVFNYGHESSGNYTRQHDDDQLQRQPQQKLARDVGILTVTALRCSNVSPTAIKVMAFTLSGPRR